MPSTMIHLIAAKKFKPEGLIEYWIGSLAPDSISDWRVCDEKHLRNEVNREEALINLANSLNLDNDFNLGIIFHLYVDYIWDNGPLKEFVEEYVGEDEWYVQYSYEIGRASSWLYNQKSWSKGLWQNMVAFDFNYYHDDYGYSGDLVFDLIERNYRWHEEVKYESIGIFNETLIEDITTRIAEEFEGFMGRLDV